VPTGSYASKRRVSTFVTASGDERHGLVVALAVVEVYPAAALQSWGLAWRVYKGAPHAEHRRQPLEALFTAVPWFELSEQDAGRLGHSDDAFDAVIAAFVARAAAIGAVGAPSSSDAELAAREGWIAIPTGPLDQLLSVDPARSPNHNRDQRTETGTGSAVRSQGARFVFALVRKRRMGDSNPRGR